MHGGKAVNNFKVLPFKGHLIVASKATITGSNSLHAAAHPSRVTECSNGGCVFSRKRNVI